MNPAHKHWTEADLDFIRSNYSTLTNPEIAAALGRTVEAVHYQGWALKLKKPPGFRIAAVARAKAKNYRPKEKVAKVKRPAGLVAPSQPKSRAPGWASSNDASQVQARSTAEARHALPAVIPADVKITRAPTPLDRYAVDPDAVTFGVGFAAVGVGRDVRTGLGWGQGA